MNRTRTLLAALITLTALAGPAWSAAASTTPCTATYGPNVVTVGLNPKSVTFTGPTGPTCTTQWTLLQSGGLWSADWRTPKSVFGTWLENADAGTSTVSVNHSPYDQVFTLLRGTRVHDGVLQVADWDTETWVPLANARVTVQTGARTTTARTTRTGRIPTGRTVTYPGTTRLAPVTATR